MKCVSWALFHTMHGIPAQVKGTRLKYLVLQYVAAWWWWCVTVMLLWETWPCDNIQHVFEREPKPDGSEGRPAPAEPSAID